ncbi:MAG: CHAP domain-containing protein [Acetobacteraceae bacterium]
MSQSGRVAQAKGKLRNRQYARAGGGGISCVPFARNDSGIQVSGNAWQWWDNASGVYARGAVPESGSVLTFRSNGRMRLGHVAVVSRIINPREIEIEHANWWGPGARGGVARNIPVVDVSANNDWSAVRVGLGQSGQFGSVYPTYGFIYDRPDTGVMLASRGAPAPQADLNPAPSDLRPVADRGWQTYEEVAEAPAVAKRHKPRTAQHQASSRVHHVAATTRR